MSNMDKYGPIHDMTIHDHEPWCNEKHGHVLVYIWLIFVQYVQLWPSMTNFSQICLNIISSDQLYQYTFHYEWQTMLSIDKHGLICSIMILYFNKICQVSYSTLCQVWTNMAYKDPICAVMIRYDQLWSKLPQYYQFWQPLLKYIKFRFIWLIMPGKDKIA